MHSVFGTVFVTNLANDLAARDDIELANLLLASTEYEADKDDVIDRDSWRKVSKYSNVCSVKGDVRFNSYRNVCFSSWPRSPLVQYRR